MLHKCDDTEQRELILNVKQASTRQVVQVTTSVYSLVCQEITFELNPTQLYIIYTKLSIGT